MLAPSGFSPAHVILVVFATPGESQATEIAQLNFRSGSYTPIVHSTGRTDVMCTRFTFTGTPTADGFIAFGRDINYGAGAWDASTPIEVEADVYLDQLANFRQLSVNAVISGVGVYYGGQAGNSNPSDTITAPVSGHFRPRLSYGFTASPGIFSGNMAIRFPAGHPVSGAIEVLGFGAFLCPTLPNATS